MSTESESAEQVIRISLEGFEVVAKLTGDMAKNFGAMLYAIAKDNKRNKKGKVRLSNMLKNSDGNLSIFSIKEEDYQNFKQEAKRYGFRYCALYNKNEKTKDGLVDLMVNEKDAVLVNRVVERYNITKVEIDKVNEIVKEQETKENTDKGAIDLDVQKNNTSQELLDKLLKKGNVKEENENNNPSNIQITEKEVLSESSLKKNEGNERKNNTEEKPSIKEKIERIKEQQAVKEKEKEKEKEPEIIADNPKKQDKKEIEHQQPKNNKNKKKRREK